MTPAHAAGTERLLRNRDFTLLWAGDVVSGLGSEASLIAMPLLVLSLTGSPTKAGVVGFARSLAYPVTTLPAGVIADRVDRRVLMIVCAAGRGLAMGSIVLLLAIGRPPLGQLLAVAFVNAALWSASLIAERGLLPAVVPGEALADAVALNEARESVAVVGGPALGGALFGLARALPFAADTASFAAAMLALVGIRTRVAPRARPSSAGTGSPARLLLRDIAEGVSWLWRAPFLRAGSLLYAAANVTLGAVLLLGVLVARHHGASSAAIGVAYAIVGAGGIVGATLAGPLRRRLGTRWSAVCEPWFSVVFVPLLLLCHSAVAVGVVLGLSMMPIALSSSVVVGHRLTLTPDHLRGRVQAAASFVAGSLAWLGPLVIGVLFQEGGEAVAVLSLAGWALAVALAATLSRGLRQAPAAPPPPFTR